MQLAVIAKEPRPGKVKTRLHPPLSLAEAADVARAALSDTLRAVRATPAHRYVLVLEGDPGDWVPPGFEVVAQRGSGLAERLRHAFQDCGSDEPTLLVGMDTPQITPTVLSSAASGLDARRAAVLGPALDGGYWCLGLTEPDPSVFDRVEMSSSRTGAQQLAQLRACGFAVTLVDPLRDVDTYADACAVAEEAPGSNFAACLGQLAATA